jgi:hypothetical protein
VRWKLALVLVLGAWCALFFSGTGVLVRGELVPVERRQADKPRLVGDFDIEQFEAFLAKEAGVGELIECTYFIGTGFIQRVHWYDTSGSHGVAACPRTVGIGERS